MMSQLANYFSRPNTIKLRYGRFSEETQMRKRNVVPKPVSIRSTNLYNVIEYHSKFLQI